MMEEEQVCYNKGCGKKFKTSENSSGSCTYHPGEPFFHDAYKSWSCCKKKTTDFTEFLNTKGCTEGQHNNIKPKEPEKPKSKPKDNDKVVSHTPPVQKPMERPCQSAPLIRLPTTISASLKTALKAKPVGENVKRCNNYDLKIGMPCNNGGCRKTYGDINDQSPESACVFHPGTPIFHEGMKYWSCCQRKTTDFSSFLSQEGCETGTHLWLKTGEMKSKENTCRYDWHQTASHIIISIYAKLVNPDLSYIEVNPVRLCVHLVFGQEKNTFDLQTILYGVIDIDSSKVNMLGTKVEINLKKAEPVSWGKLDLPNMGNLLLNV